MKKIWKFLFSNILFRLPELSPRHPRLRARNIFPRFVLANCFFILISIFVPVVGFAQEEPASGTLTLAGCLQAALSTNPGYLAQQQSVSTARFRQSRAKTSYMPRLKADETFTTLKEPFAFSSGDGKSTSIGDNKIQIKGLHLTQPVYIGGSFKHGIKAANADVEMERETLRGEKEDLCRELSEAYFDVLTALALQDVASQALFDTLSQEKQVQNLIEAGVALKSDALKIRVAVLERQENVIKAANAVALSLQNLSNLAGFEVKPPLASFSFQVSPKVVPLERIEAVLMRHPYVQAFLAKLKKQGYMVKISHFDTRPMVGVLWNYNSGTQFSESTPNWDLNLIVSFNVFDAGEAKMKIRETKSDFKKQTLEFEDLKRKITLAVKSAALKLNETESRVGISTEAEVQAAESKRQVEENYKAGSATSQDLLDAEVALVAAQNRHVTAIFERSRAEVAFWHTLGCLEDALDGKLSLPTGLVKGTSAK